MSAFATAARTRRAAPRRTMRGVGIVEIMIALALGLVIVAALGQLYSGSAKSHQVSYTMAQVGEGGRFAVDLLSSELRMAGYLSCGGSRASVANTLDPTVADDWPYQSNGIEGYEGGIDSFPSDFTGEVLPGTDLLILRRAAVDLARTVVDDDAPNAVIEIQLDHGFQPGEVLVASNPSCTQASIFQVTGVSNESNPSSPSLFDAIEHDELTSNSPGNCTERLFGNFDCSAQAGSDNGVFRPGSVIGRFLVAAYYVTDTDPPYLARKRLAAEGGNATIVTEQLVRNVQNFQLLYGRNTDQDAGHIVDDYVTADQVSDWGDVVSVNFGLLMRSNDGGVRTEATSQTFTLAGTTVTTSGDRYLRRAFGNVIALRNNLP